MYYCRKCPLLTFGSIKICAEMCNLIIETALKNQKQIFGLYLKASFLKYLFNLKSLFDIKKKENKEEGNIFWYVPIESYVKQYYVIIVLWYS